MKSFGAAMALMLICSGTMAATGKPNPVNYSYKVWAHGKLASGQVSTATTPFGTLTCSGGTGYTATGIRKGNSSPRNCHW